VRAVVKRVSGEVRGLARYVGLVLLRGLTILRFGINGVMVMSGVGLITIGAFVLGMDRFVLVLAIALALAIVWFVGGYRLWKETEHAREVVVDAAVGEPAARGDGVPLDVDIADRIKYGRALIRALEEPMLGRLQAQQVDPWTATVTKILSEHDPALARRFIDSDEGVAPWNPMLVSPSSHIKVMESRVAFLEDLLRVQS